MAPLVILLLLIIAAIVRVGYPKGLAGRHQVLIKRWQAAWRLLGARSPPEDLYGEILSRYQEPHRRYHTLHHIEECLEQLDRARFLAERPAEVEIALWFHDAIYDMKRNDNEEKSAVWARESFLSAGVDTAAAQRVYALVLATRHDALPQAPDACLMVDIDLSILGAPIERFEEYEQQIREEYSWVPERLFRRKRKQILEGFLARARIFNSDYFFGRYEASARMNIARSLKRLSA